MEKKKRKDESLLLYFIPRHSVITVTAFGLSIFPSHHRTRRPLVLQAASDGGMCYLFFFPPSFLAFLPSLWLALACCTGPSDYVLRGRTLDYRCWGTFQVKITRDRRLLPN